MTKSIRSNAYAELETILIAARKHAGLTQQDVARALHTPQSFVSKYESGERRLDIIELRDIARVQGVKVSDLMSED